MGSSGPVGKDSEALQGWILKFGEDRKRLRTSLENVIDWIANKSLPWVAYREFMSDCLIVFDIQPEVLLLGVGETWRHLFVNFVLRVTGPESTIACKYDHILAGLKAVIYGSVHAVQAIWDTNLTSTTVYPR